MTPLEIIFLLPSIRFELFSNIVALCDKIQLTFLRLRPILSPIARRQGYNFLTHRESYVPLSLNLPSLFTMMLPTDLKDKIKIKSKQLGFILAGVTTPDPPPHYSTFENWLAQNQHGTIILPQSVHAPAAPIQKKFSLNVNPFLCWLRPTHLHLHKSRVKAK